MGSHTVLLATTSEHTPRLNPEGWKAELT